MIALPCLVTRCNSSLLFQPSNIVASATGYWRGLPDRRIGTTTAKLTRATPTGMSIGPICPPADRLHAAKSKTAPDASTPIQEAIHCVWLGPDTNAVSGDESVTRFRSDFTKSSITPLGPGVAINLRVVVLPSDVRTPSTARP